MSELREPWNNPAYKALRERQKSDFIELLSDSFQIDLSNCFLRGIDLSEISLTKVNLKGAYLHSADIRGADLSAHNLEGCSIHKARISGVLFPDNVLVEEILMSLNHGTRIRIQKSEQTEI